MRTHLAFICAHRMNICVDLNTDMCIDMVGYWNITTRIMKAFSFGIAANVSSKACM